MLSAVAAVLIVPPLNLALLALAALALSRRRVAAGLLGLLVLLAVPEVSGTLLAALERGLPEAGIAPQAIVVLGGDVVPSGPDGAQDIGALTLERLRAGAALARRTGLPLLMSGGRLAQGSEPLAVLMARSLHDDFGLNARWTEDASQDTWGNAALSAALLKRDGIAAVYIVSHPWHLRRALIAFDAAGLPAIAAPLPHDRMPQGDAQDFVPHATDWRRSYFALHEWIGCAWYALRRARG